MSKLSSQVDTFTPPTEVQDGGPKKPENIQSSVPYFYLIAHSSLVKRHIEIKSNSIRIIS